MEVVATAVNGRVALTKFAAAKLDLVLLDVEMPEMDGLETVRELRKIDSRVPVIMFSTLTERGASVTFEALALGATDYVTKPSNLDGAATLDAVTRELIPKIRGLCRLPGAQSLAVPAPKAIPHVAPPPMPRRQVGPAKIVIIGVSTGGPDALAHVLPMLPAQLPVLLLIAQHMPPIFTTMLAAHFFSKSQLPVRECVFGERLSAGCAVVAPGDFPMVVEPENGSVVLKTHQGPRENFCRPSVDVLFWSVATVFRERTLAVVLTGKGQDGLKGLKRSGAMARASMFRMKPPAWYGACRASSQGLDWPTRFCLLIKLLRKSFARRRCRLRQTHRLNRPNSSSSSGYSNSDCCNRSSFSAQTPES